MLYIIGAGDHAKVVRSAAIFNQRPTRFISEQVNGNDTVSEADFLDKTAEFLTTDSGLICGIGSTGSTIRRREVLARYKNWTSAFHNVIHPNAGLDHDIRFGRGIFIAQGCQIVRGAVIDDHAIINTGVIVDHDSSIGTGTHVGPGSILCGSVTCGDWVHVGSGSVIIQGCHIANGVVLGAGTVVNKDIVEPGSTWVGAPARRIR